jgi:hypothetical protein
MRSKQQNTAKLRHPQTQFVSFLPSAERKENGAAVPPVYAFGDLATQKKTPTWMSLFNF